MPLPIVRKIGDLHRRIVIGASMNPPGNYVGKDWSNLVVSGDIGNLFDGDPTTFVEIANDNGGTNGVGLGNSYITFDLGKPRILDRFVLTNYSGDPIGTSLNGSFEFRIHQGFWAPGSNIFTTSQPDAKNWDDGVVGGSYFNHNSTTPHTTYFPNSSIDTSYYSNTPAYYGTPVSNHEWRYITFILPDNNSQNTTPY